MSKSSRNTKYAPRREPVIPVHHTAKTPPSTACVSCGREAGCNCHARDADEQDRADMAVFLEGQRLDRIEASERWERDHSCTVCGRDSGCGCVSVNDDPLIDLCLNCGRVSDETCRCQESPEERAARFSDENLGMTE